MKTTVRKQKESATRQSTSDRFDQAKKQATHFVTLENRVSNACTADKRVPNQASGMIRPGGDPRARRTLRKLAWFKPFTPLLDAKVVVAADIYESN